MSYNASGLFADLQQEFSGKCVIVAGGAGGIGAALVGGFHALGAKVVILDKNDIQAQAIASSLETSAGKFQPEVITADLTQENTRKKAVEQASRVFGPPAAFVSTIGFDQRIDFGAASQDHFEQMLRINFIAPILAARDIAVRMREGGGGTVCIFTSRHGSEINEPDMTGYGAAKAALDSGIHHLAVHAGKENTPDNIVRVFGFCPGWVQTESQQARFADAAFAAAQCEQLVPVPMRAQDLVMPVIFNMSRFAGLLSGTILRYDGGEAQIRRDSVSAGSRQH